jgi:two-component system, LytTR family, sensor kinase
MVEIVERAESVSRPRKSPVSYVTRAMAELLNLVGLSTGVVLYAMLLAMVLGASRPSHTQARFDPLLLATAILGLIWNLCALPAYELPKLGIQGPFPLLTAAGFAALGFLPAVVVQSVLRGRRDKVRGWSKQSLCAAAYALSTIAALVNTRAAAVGQPLPSTFGMRLLTYGFIALVIPVAAATRRQPGARRALWIAALSIFAVSALHLTQLHRGDSSWPIELLGHHASLPLAFAILYQDFPFALADLFLKRALTLLTLVGAAILAVAGVGAIHSPEVPLRDPRDVGVLVTMWVVTALCYPKLRDGVGWFVDHVLLNRPNYTQLRTDIAQRAQQHQEVPAMLDEMCSILAPPLSARTVRWVQTSSPAAMAGIGDDRTATTVPVPVTESPHFAIEVADLAGGRRLLSDDRAALEAIALVVGRRIDAIRLTQERYERQLREQEIGKLASEAELRALRAQINPHFLFNALTTLGYLIQTAPGRALETLMRLTTLLRAVLRSEGELTTLGRELDLVESYLEIERARFEDRLRVTIDVPEDLRAIQIPPLVLQPIVENAVKHGIAPLRRGGDVSVIARVEPAAPAELVISVVDTGAGATPEELEHGRQRGVGLRNVEQRLACQYGPVATLSVVASPGAGTTARMCIPVATPAMPANGSSTTRELVAR